MTPLSSSDHSYRNVILQFEDDPSLIEAQRRDLSTALDSGWHPLSRVLEFPVHFIVAGHEMLGGHEPLIYLANIGLSSVRAAQSGRAFLNLSDTHVRLVFVCLGDTVLISSEVTAAHAYAPYADVLHVWQGFRKRVGDFLNREFPELRSHTLWGNQLQMWLPEASAALYQPRTRRERKSERRSRRS